MLKINIESNKIKALNDPLKNVEGISNIKEEMAEIGYPKHKRIIINEVNFPKKTFVTKNFKLDHIKNKSISY